MPLLCRLLTVLLLLSAAGCGSSGSSDDAGDSANPDLTTTTLSGTTDSEGLVTFEFTIGESVAGAQLVVFPPEGRVRLTALIDPAGSDLARGLTQNITDAVATRAAPSSLGLPLPGQGLRAGTWQARYQVVESRGNDLLPNREVTLQLITKRDGDLSAGNVRVNLIFVGPTADSDDTRDALEDATDIASIILDQVRLRLDVEEYEISGPDILPDPRDGDPLYDDISNAVRPNAVNIVVGVDVDGLQNDGLDYSIPGGIPGAAVPSPRSGSPMSVLEMTDDGRFNDDGSGSSEEHNDEVRLAGEEMAQLIGHWLGLAHNVDLRGNRVIASDSLPDTESCITEEDCQDEADVRENFMFPYPLEIEGTGDEYYFRARVTDDQAEAMHRSVLVD